MRINLTPMRRDDRLDVSIAGDVLTVNGDSFDFSALAEGDRLPRHAVACDWLASDVTRTDGGIVLTLILPHGAAAPDKMLFPAPITVTEDGPVTLPSQETPQ